MDISLVSSWTRWIFEWKIVCQKHEENPIKQAISSSKIFINWLMHLAEV